MKSKLFSLAVLFCFSFVLICVGCKGKAGSKQQEVVVYTSLDKVFSEPVLKAFEKETGIKVLDVYDSEATETTGLVNRLIAEKDNPKADIFWNSETGRTDTIEPNVAAKTGQRQIVATVNGVGILKSDYEAKS